jgi:predicted membrane metal-binding protein
VYFFAEDIAKAIFFGSLACNIYIRMLSFNFKTIVNTSTQHKAGKVFLTIISGMRMAIIAGLFALFILKFKLNLVGLALSFILYKLVLFLTGYYSSLVPKAREQGL